METKDVSKHNLLSFGLGSRNLLIAVGCTTEQRDAYTAFLLSSKRLYGNSSGGNERSFHCTGVRFTFLVVSTLGFPWQYLEKTSTIDPLICCSDGSSMHFLVTAVQTLKYLLCKLYLASV